MNGKDFMALPECFICTCHMNWLNPNWGLLLLMVTFDYLTKAK